MELSAIYHDVVKDRLYTDPANSHRRRSTQTALHRMVTSLSKILAPILVLRRMKPGNLWGVAKETPFTLPNGTRVLLNAPAEQDTWKTFLHCENWRCLSWKKRVRPKPSARRLKPN